MTFHNFQYNTRINLRGSYSFSVDTMFDSHFFPSLLHTHIFPRIFTLIYSKNVEPAGGPRSVLFSSTESPPVLSLQPGTTRPDAPAIRYKPSMDPIAATRSGLYWTKRSAPYVTAPIARRLLPFSIRRADTAFPTNGARIYPAHKEGDFSHVFGI